VDPRFYHLDVALTVLDDTDAQLAYYPPAFSAASQAVLRGLYPDAIIASTADAHALGLNCVSDGCHVFIPAQADELRDQIRAAGFRTVEIDLSELRRGGGSVKCCTQEIRPASDPGPPRVGHPTRGGRA
jgi:N-dimethylarginine dimethylaminohydrolase